MHEHRKHDHRWHVRRHDVAREHDLTLLVVLASQRKWMLVLERHRYKTRVCPERLAYQTRLFRSTDGANFRGVTRFVKQRHGRKIDARDFPSATQTCIDDFRLRIRRVQLFNRAIEFALLDLRPFQLDEHSFVLHCAQCVSTSFRGKSFLASTKRFR